MMQGCKQVVNFYFLEKNYYNIKGFSCFVIFTNQKSMYIRRFEGVGGILLAFACVAAPAGKFCARP